MDHNFSNQFSFPATKAWAAQGKQLSIDGRQIFVHECGSGPSLLFLHGFPTSCFDWCGTIELLSPFFHCVSFDFLGFGFSDKPVAFSYSLFEQADLVEKLASKLGINQASVISHDMGTSVHSELLARRDEGKLSFELDRSIFLNGSMLQWLAHITPFQQLLANNATIPDAIEVCKGPFESIYIPALKALMAVPTALSTDDEQVMVDLLKHQDGQLRLPAIAGYMRERYIHSARWLGALERCPSPLAFVWAANDPIAHVEMGREHARRSPQATYIELADLGHFLMLESPERLTAALREVLSSNPNR